MDDFERSLEQGTDICARNSETSFDPPHAKPTKAKTVLYAVVWVLTSPVLLMLLWRIFSQA